MPVVLVRKIQNSVRKKSVKSQGIFREFYLAMFCGNPVVGVFSYILYTFNYIYLHFHCESLNEPKH